MTFAESPTQQELALRRALREDERRDRARMTLHAPAARSDLWEDSFSTITPPAESALHARLDAGKQWEEA